MRRASVRVNGIEAGILEEQDHGGCTFTYHRQYHGIPVSLTMPCRDAPYLYHQFPPFFEGLLPEGVMLEALLRKYKLDKNDFFGQIVTVGDDLVGAVTVEEVQ